MKLLYLYITFFSFIVSISAYSQANLEVPTDRLLTDADDLAATANGLSDDFKNQLTSTANDPDLKTTIINAGTDDFLSLTDQEKRLLGEMGMSDSEINSLDFINDPRGSTGKVSNTINKYIGTKEKEVIDVAKKDAIPGLGASIIGLTFTTFLGPLVLIKCWSQTSAKVFGGASVAWIGLEMMSWNNYKVELEQLSRLGDTAKFEGEVKILANRILTLHKEIQDRMDKAGISSIENAGEEINDDLTFIQAKIAELREVVQRFQKEFNKFSDDQLAIMGKLRDSIKLIRDNTQKKVRNATVAGVGMGVASGLAFAEQYNLIGSAGGKCFGGETGGAEAATSYNPIEWIIPSAHADAQETAVANFDKLGIPIGGGMLAAYLAFKAKFLNPIMATGTSRGITFGVMAGMAGIAAWKMREFVKYLDDQIRLIDEVISVLGKRINRVDGLLTKGDRFLQFVEQVIIPQAKQVVDRVDAVIDDLKEKVDEYKDEIDSAVDGIKDEANEFIENNQDKLNEIEDDVNQEINDLKHKVDDAKNQIDDAKESINNFESPSSSFFNHLIEGLMSTAHAARSYGSQCLIGVQNIQIDKNCDCRKKNKCTSLSLGAVKGKKNDITAKLIEKSHQVTTGLKYLSNGMSKKADQYFDKIVSDKEKIDQINVHFLKKLNKKGLNQEYFQKAAEREIAKLEPVSRKIAASTNFSPPPKLLKRSGFKMQPSKTRSGNKNTKAMIKLKNIIMLKQYLENKKYRLGGTPSRVNSKGILAKMSEEELMEGLSDIEEDKSKDLFKIISRRYFLIYQRKN